MIFNEPEVLAAIGTAIGTEADAVIIIEEHERKKKPGKRLYLKTSPGSRLCMTLRAKVHDGRDSELMADTIPVA
jgi:hypothetical protein